jgi:ferredoxin-thioredoxin reductase catalytic subunit
MLSSNDSIIGKGIKIKSGSLASLPVYGLKSKMNHHPSLSFLGDHSKPFTQEKTLENSLINQPHKRTTSEVLGALPTKKNSKSSIEKTHKQLLEKLKFSINPEEKLTILLVFLDELVSKNHRYQSIFETISDTIKLYQTHQKQLHVSEEKYENLEIKKVYGQNPNFTNQVLQGKIRRNSSFGKIKIPKVFEDDSGQKFLIKNDNILCLNSRKINPPYPTKNNYFIPKIQIPEIPEKGYHQEFIDKYDEFSESWRKEVSKLNAMNKSD